MDKPFESFYVPHVGQDANVPKTQERRAVTDVSRVYISGTLGEDHIIRRQENALRYLKTMKSDVEWRAESWFYGKTFNALMLWAAISALLGGEVPNLLSEYDLNAPGSIVVAGHIGILWMGVLLVGSFKARAARRAFNRANLEAFRQNRLSMDDVH